MKSDVSAYIALVAAFVAFISPIRGDDVGTKSEKRNIRAADGVNIVCEVRGQGDTVIIFLHGWCGDHEYWKNQADAFAKNYRVITVDQAGHGESGKNRKEWTTKSLASDVEAIVKSLGLKRVILVGHSMGGPIALMAAKSLTGTVIGVVGVDTLANAERTMPDEARKHFLDGFASDFKGSMRSAFDGMLPEKSDPELKQWLVNRAAAQDPAMALALFGDLTRLNNKELLREARVPVRCINSTGGYKFHTPTAIDVNKKYADYDAVFIEGVGHYPMLEKPAEFNRKLQGVLKEISAKK